MTSNLSSMLRRLEALRATPTVLYFCNDQSPARKQIEESDTAVLYDYLRAQGSLERLNVILYTGGGDVSVSHNISLLFREFVTHVTVTVLHKACSAGTLLCLGADQIVMDAHACIGPIDAHLHAAGANPPGSSPVVSASDIRAFCRMGEAWFGLQSEESRLQMLTLLCKHFFPTALSAFFQADQQVRQIATQLLSYQLPEVEEDARELIVDFLSEGCYVHEHRIGRSTAKRLGLRVVDATAQEADLLHLLWQACNNDSVTGLLQAEHRGVVDGLIIGSNFVALHVRAQHDQGINPRLAADELREDMGLPGLVIAEWHVL